MSRRTLHPLLQSLVALILLGVGLGLAIVAIASPLLEALDGRAQALARLARYEHLSSAAPSDSPLYNPDDLAGIHLDDAEAQLSLQAAIDRLSRVASVAVQSIQPQAAEHLGEFGRGVWVEMAFTSDLQALTDFLASLDQERPVLLVRRLEIEKGEGPRPDVFMRVKLDIGRAWRSRETPA